MNLLNLIYLYIYTVGYTLCNVCNAHFDIQLSCIELCVSETTMIWKLQSEVEMHRLKDAPNDM